MSPLVKTYAPSVIFYQKLLLIYCSLAPSLTMCEPISVGGVAFRQLYHNNHGAISGSTKVFFCGDKEEKKVAGAGSCMSLADAHGTRKDNNNKKNCPIKK